MAGIQEAISANWKRALDTLVDNLPDETAKISLKDYFQQIDQDLQRLEKELRTPRQSTLVYQMSKDKLNDMSSKCLEELKCRCDLLNSKLEALIIQYRHEKDGHRSSPEQMVQDMRAVGKEFKEKIAEFKKQYDDLLKPYLEQKWNESKSAREV